MGTDACKDQSNIGNACPTGVGSFCAIVCNGGASCSGNATFTPASESGHILCTGTDACKDATINLQAGADASQWKITCDGGTACSGLNFGGVGTCSGASCPACPPLPGKTYTYDGITSPSATFTAEDGEIDEPDSTISNGTFSARRDTIGGWSLFSEASTAEYANLVGSDDSRYQTADPNAGDNAVIIFELYLDEDASDITEITVSAEIGRRDSRDFGWVYLWNYTTGSYTIIGDDTGSADAVISKTISIDADQYVHPTTSQVTVFVVNEDDSDWIRVDNISVTVDGPCISGEDGSACDDGLFCNGSDTCSGGSCSNHAGDPCSGGSECNATCNEAAGNCFDTVNTPCSDDAITCTADVCDGAGTCGHIDASAQAGGCGEDGTYRCDDSNDPGGPSSFTYEDITSSGTALNLADDGTSTAALDFTFSFYGTDYTLLSVCANGLFSFTTNDCPFAAVAIPNATAPNAAIMAFAEDLNPTLGGTIHYETLGSSPQRRFIVQFTDIQHFGGGSAVSFQLVLFESANNIEVRYLSAVPDGDTHSIGIENAAGSDGIQVVNGNPGTLTNFTIRYDTGVACDDGNTCTFHDICVSSVCGGTVNTPVATSCGDGSDTGCTNPDTCDGAGSCDVNDESLGFTCGSATDTECTNPDTCDGAGSCDNNDETAGFACGTQGDECLVD
ncbi:MAG TPA: hypothetical protein EYQ35_01260, partial [candidate division UBP10 bacterium]|nr:hypothetical protein [Candidatus Binatota bacterium]